MALKGNQGTLHDDVRTFLDDPQTELSVSDSTVDGDHGRIETRTGMVSTDISWLQADHRWSGLTAVGKVVRVRETADKTTTETAYYLLSTAMAAERFGEVVRSHWAVENRLHWCLDVTMNEDQARNRMDQRPAEPRRLAAHGAQPGSQGNLQGIAAEESSGGPPGATPSWPRCWLNFEMRLPCRASSRVDVASRYTRQTRGLP